MLSVWASTRMLSGVVAVCEPLRACTVKVHVPAAPVGVPAITPGPAVSVSPGGRVPLAIDQVYGGVPPVADSPAVYARPSIPDGSAVVVTVRAVGGGEAAV